MFKVKTLVLYARAAVIAGALFSHTRLGPHPQQASWRKQALKKCASTDPTCVNPNDTDGRHNHTNVRITVLNKWQCLGIPLTVTWYYKSQKCMHQLSAIQTHLSWGSPVLDLASPDNNLTPWLELKLTPASHSVRSPSPASQLKEVGFKKMCGLSD
jgi:hypothetical protein